MGERTLNFGADATDADFQIRDSDPAGGDLIIEHLPTGATFEYDATENAWVPTDPIGTANRKVPGLVSESVNTDEMLNSIGDARIQTAFDGLVVPVAPGVGMDSAVDPTTTTTPVQDAVDAVNAATADGEGAVLLPPDTVQEDGTITGLGRINLIGWGEFTSSIEFTDLSSDGILVAGKSDGRGAYLDGLELDGSDKASRTSGSAIRFTGTAGRFNMGTVRFDHWGGDPVIWADTGAPFSSHWQNLRFQTAGYSVRAIRLDEGGPNLSIGNMYAGNDAGVPDIRQADGGAALRIGMLNLGGGSGGLFLRENEFGRFYCGYINWEPSLSTSLDTIVQCDNQIPATFECIQMGGTEGDTDYMFSQGGGAPGNNIVGQLLSPKGTLNNNKIEIETEPSFESWYYGQASEIDNNAGSSTGLFRSLATAGIGNG